MLGALLVITKRMVFLMNSSRRYFSIFSLCIVFAVAGVAAPAPVGKSITVKGYVIDSACAYTKGLSKPISEKCAQACAKAGSPLVILADTGTIYLPIADATPASGQNEKLLPFAGQRVTVTGKAFQRGG